MNMQLERMQNKGLGKPAKSLQELQLEWFCLPGAAPELQAELQVRFDTLVSKS